jgi:hypothetical protein
MAIQRRPGFDEIHGLASNYQAFETGRVYLVLSLTMAGRFSHDFLNM